jgi:hypothetical protein
MWSFYEDLKDLGSIMRSDSFNVWGNNLNTFIITSNTLPGNVQGPSLDSSLLRGICSWLGHNAFKAPRSFQKESGETGNLQGINENIKHLS